jgi:hypothetical protein
MNDPLLHTVATEARAAVGRDRARWLYELAGAAVPFIAAGAIGIAAARLDLTFTTCTTWALTTLGTLPH